MSWTFLMQISFAIWFFVIHFIPIPPLNDIDKFPNKTSWKFFLFGNWVVLLALIFGYWLTHHVYFGIGLLIYLSLLLTGHLNTWWLPYLFGWPKVFAQDSTIDHKATVRFLPSRDNRPVPDIGYCLFGILLAAAYILTFYTI
jgi:hypothetical protein